MGLPEIQDSKESKMGSMSCSAKSEFTFTHGNARKPETKQTPRLKCKDVARSRGIPKRRIRLANNISRQGESEDWLYDGRWP